jgi:hypothetical protein
VTTVWNTNDLITAARLNQLAQVPDIGVAGTPTGDALKAAIDAEITAQGGGSSTGAAAGLAIIFGA